MTAVGATAYSYDRDGFLQTRGEEVFEYDSLGHLVSAFSKDNAYKVRKYCGFAFSRIVNFVHCNFGGIKRPVNLKSVCFF